MVALPSVQTLNVSAVSVNVTTTPAERAQADPPKKPPAVSLTLPVKVNLGS